MDADRYGKIIDFAADRFERAGRCPHGEQPGECDAGACDEGMD